MTRDKRTLLYLYLNLVLIEYFILLKEAATESILVIRKTFSSINRTSRITSRKL
jgi:hypothetical protein